MEQLTRAGRRYLDWRGQEVVCRTRFGARMACNLADLIQRKIAYFGVWEPHLTAYFGRALAPGDVLADVGANVGYYSLLGAGLVGPGGRVVAVEASPAIFASLSANIRRNDLANVRAVNKAVADAPGRLPVFAAGDGNIGRTSVIEAEGKVFESFVEALPLHEILTADELARLRLVKIDIEGAEGPVVKSIRQNISAYGAACEFAIEVSPDCAWIIEAMAEIGFHAYGVPNDYGDRDYLRRQPQRPARHRLPLTEQCDFIFSRVDAEYL
jgi:FkbM family methyltransferase